MPATLPILTSIPDVLTGYPIDGEWEVVVPIARTNEVLNPSFETNLTGYTAGAGSLARSTAKQYHGVYSAAYTPTSAVTDGFFYAFTSNWTAGQFRAVSCKFWGQPNVPYILSVNSNVGTELQAYRFKGAGRWQWVYLYWMETSTTTRRIYFRKDNSNDTHTFYVDGVQSEVINTGEFVSTYIDGDQSGFLPNQFPVPYYWNGTPHASTSTRIALTRSGGHVIPFKRFGLLITAIVGLGLPTVHNVSTDYAQLDGGYPSYTRKPTSQFSIAGNVSEPTYRALRASRSGLSQYFDRDAGMPDQPLLLRYRHTDSCGNILSDTVALPCKYVSGWDGQSNNHFAQVVTMTFETYLPTINADGESGSTLNVQTSIASNANGVLQRSPAGVWSSVGSFTAGFGVYSIVRGQNGLIYFAGDFTPSPANCIVSYNGSSLSALGTGATGGLVYQMAVMPNGDLIAGGVFTSMGGVANTNKIAKWNGSNWSSISSGFTGTEIRSLVVNASGILFAGGVFTNIGGVAATNVAQYNGTSWSAVGGGLVGGVNSMIAVGSKIYAAVDDNTIRMFNGSSWSTIGTASGGSAVAIAIGPNGLIYVAGTFSSINGVTAANIAYYNGVTWFPLGAGLNNGVNVRALSFDARGLLYVGGEFTQAGGISTPTGSAVWNGAAWVYSDIIPAATAHLYGALALPNGQFYQGTINAGSAIGPGITTITNTGTAVAYPTVVIKGPSSGTSRIYSLVNATTGRAVYFNLTLNAGETATLVFQPDNLSFTSDFQGNIFGSILPGSSEANFYLAKGDNSIAFLSASSTVTATMMYTPAYLSLDDIP